MKIRFSKLGAEKRRPGGGLGKPFWGPRWASNRKNDVRQADAKTLTREHAFKGVRRIPTHPDESRVMGWLALKELFPGRHSEAWVRNIPGNPDQSRGVPGNPDQSRNPGSPGESRPIPEPGESRPIPTNPDQSRKSEKYSREAEKLDKKTRVQERSRRYGKSREPLPA